MSTPASVQVDLGKLPREEIIEIAKKQAAQIKEKNHKIMDLSKALSEAQQQTPQTRLLQEKDEALRTVKDALHEKITQYDTLSQKTAMWKEQVMQMAQADQATIETLKRENAELQKELTALKDKTITASQETDLARKHLEVTNASLLQQLEAATTQLKQEQSKVATQQAEAQQKFDNLKASAIARFQAMQRTIEELQAQLHATTTRNNDLQHRITEVQKLHSQNDAANRTERLYARVTELEQQLAAAGAETDEQERAAAARVAELESLVSTAKIDAANRTERLYARATELEQQLAAAGAALQPAERTTVASAATVRECASCASLQHELHDLRDRTVKWKSQAKQLIEQEVAEKEVAVRRLAVVEADLIAARSSLVESQAENSRLGVAVRRLRDFHVAVMAKAREVFPE